MYAKDQESRSRRCRLYTQKLPGAGRKPVSDKLDQRLFSYFKGVRQNKFALSKQEIQTKAKQLANQLGLDCFKASKGYVDRFKERFNLSLRKPKHKSQQNNRSSE
ncbi:unnamed protein product [Brachionus calyciflorus]|uniref:HTH CENPB-type domain-containing protein n=1 Tax=Brachionus calyciflorus TaxID=104777 RepID=A0A814GYE1_9BILA|nr:unnamed protein product [Brachionus calyciflorus]